jgi:putative tryptophan/tyrosine transport system substrate-binding protein
MILRRAAVAVGFALAVLATASAVHAQLPKAPRIGVLLLTATPEQFDTSFREGLREVGYVAGQNIIVDYRYAAGNVARLHPLASKLVQLKVAVLVAR